MTMLHTINRSPFERTSLDSCLRVLQPGSSILLYEDAVVAAMSGTRVEQQLRSAMEAGNVFCLEPDLRARGLESEKVIEGIGLVDYEGFVELATTHERVQAWL